MLNHGYTSVFLLAMVMQFFLKIVVSPAHGGGYTWWQNLWFCRKKFNSLRFSRFFSATFLAIASPVRGWLHMQFLLRAGDATSLKKLHHHCKQKNRSCSCRFRKDFWTTPNIRKWRIYHNGIRVVCFSTEGCFCEKFILMWDAVLPIKDRTQSAMA